MPIRNKIFGIFTENHKLKFNEIEKALEIRSNKLAYYLEQLKKENILKKEGEFWMLTKESEKQIPFYPQEIFQLGVVLLAIMRDNKILLVKRDKRPYKDYWSLLGGRMLVNESIKQASLRKAKEETGFDVEFEKICSVVHERVKEKEDFKHGFIFFLNKIQTKQSKLMFNNLKWFSLDKLEKLDIIPSDYWMINNLLDKKVEIPEVIMEEVEGKLVYFNNK